MFSKHETRRSDHQLQGHLHQSEFLDTASHVVYCRLFSLVSLTATGSDTEEYKLEGNSRQTHICAEDLARSLLSTHLSSFAQTSFKLLVGFDNNLHGKHPENSGKRYHMRRIGVHLAVPPEQMLLDDSDSSLDTGGDGWHGLKVRQPGFLFGDVWEAMSQEGGGKKSGEKPQGSRSLAAGASATLPPRVVLWAARQRLPASVLLIENWANLS
eukprot:g19892.t1